MSVVKLGLVPGRNASFGKITENKSKLRWLAETDNNLDDETIVADYGYTRSLIPIPYISFHPNYSLQLCRNIDFTQDSAAPRKWEIEATYSSEPLIQPQQYDNPMDRPAKIKWKTVYYRKAIDRDINGKAICNSAGDYFDPPPEIDEAHWVASIEKNVEAVPSIILKYDNAINSDNFTIQGLGVSPRVARLSELDISDLQYQGEFTYYIFGYSLEFRPRDPGWKLRLLDQGFRYIASEDSSGNRTIEQIVDDSTPPKPITHPKLLDGSGAPLGVLGNPPPGPDTAVFLDFDVKEELPFAGLPGLAEFA